MPQSDSRLVKTACLSIIAGVFFLSFVAQAKSWQDSAIDNPLVPQVENKTESIEVAELSYHGRVGNSSQYFLLRLRNNSERDISAICISFQIAKGLMWEPQCHPIDVRALRSNDPAFARNKIFFQTDINFKEWDPLFTPVEKAPAPSDRKIIISAVAFADDSFEGDSKAISTYREQESTKRKQEMPERAAERIILPIVEKALEDCNANPADEWPKIMKRTVSRLLLSKPEDIDQSVNEIMAAYSSTSEDDSQKIRSSIGNALNHSAQMLEFMEQNRQYQLRQIEPYKSKFPDGQFKKADWIDNRTLLEGLRLYIEELKNDLKR